MTLKDSPNKPTTGKPELMRKVNRHVDLGILHCEGYWPHQSVPMVAMVIAQSDLNGGFTTVRDLGVLGGGYGGSVEVGKFTDLIAVSENPLTNIAEMQRIEFVMKGGIVMRNGFEAVHHTQSECLRSGPMH
jgi:hypothetical protein